MNKKEGLITIITGMLVFALAFGMASFKGQIIKNDTSNTLLKCVDTKEEAKIDAVSETVNERIVVKNYEDTVNDNESNEEEESIISQGVNPITIENNSNINQVSTGARLVRKSNSILLDVETVNAEKNEIVEPIVEDVARCDNSLLVMIIPQKIPAALITDDAVMPEEVNADGIEILNEVVPEGIVENDGMDGEYNVVFENEEVEFIEEKVDSVLDMSDDDIIVKGEEKDGEISNEDIFDEENETEIFDEEVAQGILTENEIINDLEFPTIAELRMQLEGLENVRNIEIFKNDFDAYEVRYEVIYIDENGKEEIIKVMFTY